jgi:molecular chaperone GrpE
MMKKDKAKAKEEGRDVESKTAAAEVTEPAVEELDEECSDELSELKEALADQEQRHLRLAAEYENFRRRSAKEREKVYGDATIDVVKTLIPLFESIDRCDVLSEALEDNDSAFAEGVRLMAQQASDLLGKLGVAAVGEKGDVFDPNVHHAVQQLPMEGVESGAVAEVIQKGYTLGERLIRPALVVVAE